MNLWQVTFRDGYRTTVAAETAIEARVHALDARLDQGYAEDDPCLVVYDVEQVQHLDTTA